MAESVFVALGTNLGERHATLDRAGQALRALATPASSYRCSQRYESPAMPVPERPDDQQPDYLNAVVALRVLLPPIDLLDALQGIERAAGRVRVTGQRWGPRTLDLDLLLYGEECIDVARLTVPHPGIAERAFVLQPLHELAPDAIVPGVGPVADLLAALPAGAGASMRPVGAGPGVQDVS